MMRLALTPLFVAISFMFAGATVAMDKENTLYIDLKDGRVVIEMRPDLAPKHVAQIKKLAREGKYDGVVFHRVIEGFMAQTGDPTGTGSGGMGETLKAEFSKEPHVRGSVSMARTSDPNSARSQFFIVLQGFELPRRPVHRVGQGHVGHGVRRQDQARPGPVGLGAAAARQDDQGPGRGRREGLGVKTTVILPAAAEVGGGKPRR